MEDIKFGILIPAYKKKFLSSAISSCLNQSYRNFELIIVNDASPENLDAVVSSFSDNRIKYYINEKNFGALHVVDNWNKCLSYSDADYVICMGDDDELMPECLSVYYKLICKFPGLGVYHGWTMLIDESDSVFDMQEHRPVFESCLSFLWHRWSCRYKQYVGDFCYDARLLRQDGGFFNLPMAWGSDDVTAVRACSGFSNGKEGIANTQQPVFKYRVNRLTISKTGSVREKIEATTLEKQWYNFFLNEYCLKNELSGINTFYYKFIINSLNKHFELKYRILLTRDLSVKSTNYIYWVKNYSKLGLNVSQFLNCIVDSIKLRVHG